jgi:glycosyltransferase A (GT-A) superfamily protein (DUF2064 family)
MIASPKSPEPGILKTRVAIQIGDTHKSAILHFLTNSYTAGVLVLPDSSDATSCFVRVFARQILLSAPHPW